MGNTLPGAARRDTCAARLNHFFDLLAQTGRDYEAATEARCDIRELEKRRRMEPAIASEWRRCLAIAERRLRAILIDRVINGVERTIALGSGRSEVTTEFSDRLASLVIQHCTGSAAGQAADDATIEGEVIDQGRDRRALQARFFDESSVLNRGGIDEAIWFNGEAKADDEATIDLSP